MFISKALCIASLLRKIHRQLGCSATVLSLVLATMLSGASPVYAVSTTFTKPIVTTTTPWNLALDVSGASKSNGAPVILWWGTGRNNQQWMFQQTGKVVDNTNVYIIRNVNSGKCLMTSGIAGAQLFQYACDLESPYQQWATNLGAGLADTIWNPAFDLCVDVLGSKYYPKASVGAWYCNDGLNQTFF